MYDFFFSPEWLLALLFINGKSGREWTLSVPTNVTNGASVRNCEQTERLHFVFMPRFIIFFLTPPPWSQSVVHKDAASHPRPDRSGQSPHSCDFQTPMVSSTFGLLRIPPKGPDPIPPFWFRLPLTYMCLHSVFVSISLLFKSIERQHCLTWIFIGRYLLSVRRNPRSCRQRHWPFRSRALCRSPLENVTNEKLSTSLDSSTHLKPFCTSLML